jgi:hypothetical protein
MMRTLLHCFLANKSKVFGGKSMLVKIGEDSLGIRKKFPHFIIETIDEKRNHNLLREFGN